MRFKNDESRGCCRMTPKGCCNGHCKKLNTLDYLSDLPSSANEFDFVEVQFKNTRKDYYLNNLKLPLTQGDLVVVEAAPGHDLGTISMTGKLVALQMKKNRYRDADSPKRILRVAWQSDIDRYDSAKALEHDTMIEARQIAKELGLDMKIGDVEYQGDGQKAIFYYIADNRVDFRQLIKKLAEVFRIRVEMRQIGVRQEAGRIGGIGPCGKQLCCAKWMTNFVSVSTNAARLQDLSLNPQKLAGQCAKLKCCLNFEADLYAEAQRKMPPKGVLLKTQQGDYRFFKSDLLASTSYYLPDAGRRGDSDPIGIPWERVSKIIEMNKRGELPPSLHEDNNAESKPRKPQDILAEESLARFDGKTGSKRRRRPRGGERQERSNGSRYGKGQERAPENKQKGQQ